MLFTSRLTEQEIIERLKRTIEIPSGMRMESIEVHSNGNGTVADISFALEKPSDSYVAPRPKPTGLAEAVRAALDDFGPEQEFTITDIRKVLAATHGPLPADWRISISGAVYNLRVGSHLIECVRTERRGKQGSINYYRRVKA